MGKKYNNDDRMCAKSDRCEERASAFSWHYAIMPEFSICTLADLTRVQDPVLRLSGHTHGNREMGKDMTLFLLSDGMFDNKADLMQP